MLYFVRCLIFMSGDLIIILIIRCKPLCNMPDTFDVISSWIFSAPPAHSYLLCVDISFEIAFVICIKVHLTLNFKILSVQACFFILISDILSPKNYMHDHCSACFSQRRHFALNVAVLVLVKRKILCDYQRKSNENFTVWMSLSIRLYYVSIKKKYLVFRCL